MTFIPTPNACSVQNIWTLYGERVENQFHVAKTTPFTLADLTALGAALDGTLVDGYASELTADSVHQEIILTALDSDSAPVFHNTYHAGTHGVGSNPSLPNNVAFSITSHTAQRGRSYRGRSYVWGFTDEEVTGNSLAAIKADAWVSILTDLLAEVVTFSATAFLAVVSTRHNNAPRTAGVATPIVSFGYHDLFLDSMRRRLPGHNVRH